MPRAPRGEKRAIMSVWDDFIHRLEQDLAECRRDLELLELGQMQHRERKGDDPWVDTTQREIDWHKKNRANGSLRPVRGLSQGADGSPQVTLESGLPWRRWPGDGVCRRRRYR